MNNKIPVNLDNLKIVPCSIACSDDEFIQIRQINSYLRWDLGIKGDWFYTLREGTKNEAICEYDVCYAHREKDVVKYMTIPYEKLPQKVLDYLQSSGYVHCGE